MRRVVAGAVLAALVAGGSVGCADRDEPGDAGTAPPVVTGPGSPPASPSPDSGVALIEIDISGGRADPPLDRVDVALGATVRIVVTSDQPDELHLHGYDLTAELAPGRPGVIEFVADQSGLFELETHESGLVLSQLQVR